MEEIIRETEKADAFLSVNQILDEGEAYKREPLYKKVYRKIRANKLAVFCCCYLILIIIASSCAFLSPYDPDKVDLLHKLEDPNMQHFFGTDNLGRDYFTRILYGGQISLVIGIAAMCISVVFGTLFGALSGFLGGKVDAFMMRIVDVLMSVPSFLFIIVINAVLKPGLVTMIIVIALFSWMSVARIVRAETMSLKKRDFILATKNLGENMWEIILRHIIPNMIPVVIVAASNSIAKAILTESSLSFLGFGVNPPIASWGSMLQGAQKQIMTQPSLAVFPGVFILLTVMSFHVIGDILRDTLDPKNSN